MPGLPSKFTEQQMRDAVAELAQGASAIAIGKRLGVSPGAIYLWRKRLAAGTARRKPAPVAQTPPGPVRKGLFEAVGEVHDALEPFSEEDRSRILKAVMFLLKVQQEKNAEPSAALRALS